VRRFRVALAVQEVREWSAVSELASGDGASGPCRSGGVRLSPDAAGEAFWLWLGGRELFVSFTTFPWFANASVANITSVQWPAEDHLYWPELDVDLSVRSIEHPEEFPLASRGA
jgi:hypothetical protein